MLGELLEYSLTCDPLAAAVEFFFRLGFVETRAGDIVSEPYAPLANGTVTIGLRQSGVREPVAVFVRPKLKEYLHALRRQHIALEFADIADDEFHRAGFKDPNGQLIVLVEARTCAPSADAVDAVSIVGSFLELSLPTHSIDESMAFWERLGVKALARGTTPSPWVRIGGHGLTLGLYEGRRFVPGLSFTCTDLDTRSAYLEAMGLALAAGAPFSAGPVPSVTLEAPSGHRLYLFGSLE
jgi:catechol 2,3-dioxygenase-like lactoylglutathione lyase family enzyme